MIVIFICFFTLGPRPSWKDPNHPFRLDPFLKLTGIPTLLRIEKGKIVDRVDKKLETAKET